MSRSVTKVVFILAVRVVWVVAQRPSFKARRNVSACCPNNGQWVAAGRKGSGRRLFQRSNFFIKKGTVYCLPHTSTTLLPLKQGYIGYISLLQQSSCFCHSSVPHQKLRRLFVGGAVQTGFLPRWCFLRFVADLGTRADRRGLFNVYVDSINSLSWSKRKVGPMLYVTELGTLESATAPWQTVPVLWVLSDWTMTLVNTNNRLFLYRQDGTYGTVHTL